uniref:Uncharacterized protein n=1 Tax=Trichobilharzia regenti TaxID=157069 RepID=A0AA85J6X0_TRIRE|nr:unnamed protein product [Trichobilharzia regenti]
MSYNRHPRQLPTYPPNYLPTYLMKIIHQDTFACIIHQSVSQPTDEFSIPPPFISKCSKCIYMVRKEPSRRRQAKRPMKSTTQ